MDLKSISFEKIFISFIISSISEFKAAFTKIIEADLLKISPASDIFKTIPPFSNPISLSKTPEILKVLFAI